MNSQRDGKKRYALVGTGSRSGLYIDALAGNFRKEGVLTALCDTNRTRMMRMNERYTGKSGSESLPYYCPEEFETMIRENRVDTVIVTSMDRTHHRYIIRAMEAGCDVISEKPLTIDDSRCNRILDTVDRTGKNLKVTFNYRYSPRNSRVKELLQQGIIGKVTSVHFEWLLDTRHGADYFRRWHREKENSGGLLVHKSTHHFDLMNWWLDTAPESVFAMGGLMFYGKDNAENRGVRDFYHRGTSPEAAHDPFALNLEENEELKKLYLEAEHEDGYLRDRNVFSDGITIEDDMSVLVRYRSGAVMTYHLTAYSPWEGYRVAFNGTKGRLEYEVVETSYISGGNDDGNRPDIRSRKDFKVEEPVRLVLRPHWEKPVELDCGETGEGGHGGGDIRLLRDIFTESPEDPLGRKADHKAGALSILTGIAANRSLAEKREVSISELVDPNRLTD